MAKCNTDRHFFRITSLQIGDLQSYLSDLSLFLAPDSKTFYVLVDNRPWLEDLVSRPAHLWQLMVTKSRMSPFAIRRARNDKKDAQNFSDLQFSSETSTTSENLKTWFLAIDATTLSKKRALLPVEKLRTSLLASSKLHRTLYGFIVFEVAWKDVRGINYLNELQTDTSLAIEAKNMRRWEFDSISQAAKGINSWFPGTQSECSLLKQHLNSMNVETDCESEIEEVDEATEYRDSLLSIRFNDRDLPFELQNLITSDLRLLTLLEAGLPSWVIFFQSYPVFCHIYRPWMCPLARILYVAISLVTVVIGFYDLYKNIPLLKATASRLCGPLFGWIETWEMVSRIKYLGTMLFLHNSEKAVKWFLMMTCTVQSYVSILTNPLATPLMAVLEVLLPIWNLFIETGTYFFSIIWILMGTFWNIIEYLIDIILLPVYFIASVIWIIVTAILYPILWCLWGILFAPIRLVLGLSNFVGFIFNHMYNFSGVIWIFVSGVFKVASNAETTVSTYEVSMLRALWNDLFSQIFRAVRSILNGFVAFFTACNRHRLSIYNHLQELIRRFNQPTQRSRVLNSIRRAKKSSGKKLVETMERRRGFVVN